MQPMPEEFWELGAPGTLGIAGERCGVSEKGSGPHAEASKLEDRVYTKLFLG